MMFPILSLSSILSVSIMLLVYSVILRIFSNYREEWIKINNDKLDIEVLIPFATYFVLDSWKDNNFIEGQRIPK